MNKLIKFIVVLFFCAVAGGCSTIDGMANPIPMIPTEFSQLLRNYETAWSNKDADALAALFAVDGFVLPNGSPPVRGRANIRKHYEDSGGPLYLRAIEWDQSGDVGYIIGEYSHEPFDNNPASGKFTLTLKKIEGEWLIMSDMDSGNSRPARQ